MHATSPVSLLIGRKSLVVESVSLFSLSSASCAHTIIVVLHNYVKLRRISSTVSCFDLPFLLSR